MKKVTILGLPLAVAGLAGCTGTPNCGASETLSILDDAIVEEVEKYASQTQRGTADEFMRIMDTYEISSIRTQAYDESIDSYQCDARVTYVYHDRERSVDFTYRVDTDQADGKTVVEYQNKMLNPILSFAMGF